MPVTPQLPARWEPIVDYYTGTDPALQALRKLRHNIDLPPSDTKDGENPLFAGIAAQQLLAYFNIRSNDPVWQPATGHHQSRQHGYLNLCEVLCVMELVCDDRMYDLSLCNWLEERHRLESESCRDGSFLVKDEAALFGTCVLASLPSVLSHALYCSGQEQAADRQGELLASALKQIPHYGSAFHHRPARMSSHGNAGGRSPYSC